MASVSRSLLGPALVALLAPLAWSQRTATSPAATVEPASALKAGFRTSIRRGHAPLTVSFESATQGDADSWTWDFGDGSTSSEPTPAHVYGTPGTYTARLSVVGEGSEDSAEEDIVVLAASACTAGNARFNTRYPLKLGTDYVPIVDDDSQGFYVVYSGRHDGTNLSTLANNVDIYLFQVSSTKVVVFGGGYGDPSPALNDAAYDALNIDGCIQGCMLLDPALTTLDFVVPHGHGDHINADIVRELRNLGYTIGGIIYHTSDGGRVSFLPGWTAQDRSLFRTIGGSGTCGEELLSYDTPLGKLWFYQRPGHTPGSIDAVLDVAGDPMDRVLIRGSIKGGTCPEPANVRTVLDAHGNVVLTAPGGSPASPTLTALTADTGSSLGGEVIHLSGSGFSFNTPGVNIVTFGDADAPQVLALDDQTLRVRVPAGTPDSTVDVMVTNNNGMATLAAAYTYLPEPALSSVSPASGSSLGGETLTLSGAGFLDGNPGVNTVTLGGATATNVTVVDDFTLTCTAPAGSPGTTVDVVVSNANGQSDLLGAYSYNPLPTLTGVSPGSGPEAGGTRVTLTGSGYADFSPGANVVTFGGVAAASVAVVDDSTLECDAPAGAAGAAVDVSVGNVNGSATLVGSYTFLAPGVELFAVTPDAGTSLGGFSVDLEGSGFLLGGANTVRFGGAAATGTTVFDDGRILCIAPAGAPGATVDVTVTNGTGTATLLGAFTYYPSPTLASVLPSGGPLSGGTVLTVSGSGFLTNDPGTNTVQVGGAPATALTVVDDGKILCTTPAGVAGSADVVVTNRNGTATLPGGFAYSGQPPVLLSVSPSAGSSLGGKSVLLAGSSFTALGAGANAVTFGGVSATSIVTFDDGSILCVTPAGPAGASVDVVVTNGNGSATLPAGYAYHPTPTITSFTPASASSLGGAGVTIDGTGFVANTAGLNKVRLVGLLATDVVVISDTRLTCRVPAGTPGSVGNVRITNDNGFALVTNGFSYHDLPEVLSVAPASGSGAGGTSLTVTGSGFLANGAGANTVLVGGNPATNVLVLDDTTLVCETPAGAFGAADVQVANLNGSGTLFGGFTYETAGPVLLSLSPSRGSSFGGTAVQLHGAGFLEPGAGTNSVTFGGKPCPTVAVFDDTSILCVAPPGTPGAVVDVVVTNDLGTGSLSSSFTYNPLPTITSVTPASGSPAGGTSVTLSGTGFSDFQAGANTVRFGGKPATSLMVANDTTLTCVSPSGTADTTVDVSVTNANGTGTAGSAFSYVTPLSLTSVAPASGPASGGTAVLLTGTGFEPGLQVLFAGQPATGVVVVNPTSISCVTPAAGPGAVDVVVQGPSGSASLGGGFTFVAGPTLLSVAPAAGSSLGGTSLTLTGTGFQAPGAGATTVTVGGQPLGSLVIVDDATLQGTVPAGTPGATVGVAVTNENGSASLPAAFTYAALPTLASASPASGPSRGGTTVLLAGSGFLQDGAGVNTVTFGGVPATSIQVLGDTSLSCKAPAGTSGETVDVVVSNQNGSATLPAAYAYTVSPPSVWNVSPGSGTSLGGVIVSIAGSGFQLDGAGTNTVRFDGTPSPTAVVVDDRTILCITPAGTAGALVDVSVTNSNGSDTLAGGYRYNALPVLSSVSPSTGRAAGGATVTLTGTGFLASSAGVNSVLFGGVAATGVVVVDDTQLTCLAPAGTAGTTVGVAVSNANGSSSLPGAFTYFSAPVLTSLSPGSGPSNGGTTVLLSGAGFLDPTAGTNQVSFGGVPATAVTTLTDTTISCATPAGSLGVSVDVVVTNGNGSATLPAAFTYGGIPPVLTSVVPAHGTSLGGVGVVVNGSGFLAAGAGTNVVTFGGVPAVSSGVFSDGQLVAVAPAGLPGSSVDVVVENQNGTGQLASAFRYHALPTIASVAPGAGSNDGGTPVTIQGSGFLADDPGPSAVSFGGQPATSVVVVGDGTLTCLAPAGVPGATVDVQLTNANGTATAAGTFRYFAEPSIAALTPASGTSLGGVAVTITGAGFVQDVVGPNAVTFGGVAATSVATLDDGTLTCVAPAGPAGATVDVVVTNSNGSATKSAAFRYHALPTLSGVAPASGVLGGGTSVTVSGTGFLVDGAGMNKVRFGGVLATGVVVVSDTTLTCSTPPGVATGPVGVRVTNSNGSILVASAFTYFLEPTLTSVTPGSGSSLGGRALTLTGSGFVNNGAGTNHVRIGGQPATSVVAVNDTTLTCVAPPGTPGATVDVVVTNDVATFSLASAFRYHQLPVLASVSPSSGGTNGGTDVVLGGAGFVVDGAGTNQVAFDGIPALSVTTLDDGSLLATTPPGALGTVDVRVSNANGAATLVAGFTYVPSPPTLVSVRPSAASAMGGEGVIVTGSGYLSPTAGTNTVYFGETRATTTVAYDDATLIAVVPPGTPGQTVDVRVTNGNGEDTLPAAFTYYPAPAVAAVSPTAGIQTGGSAITVTGTGFTANEAGPSAVTVGGAPATAVQVLTDGSLTCVVPAGDVGPADVVVSNANGSGTLVGGFRYFASTQLFAVAPPSGTSLGGTVLTLTGVGFLNDGAGQNSVTVGGAAATAVTVVDDGTLTCVAPAGTPGASVAVRVTNANGTSVLNGAYAYHAQPVLSAVAPQAGVEGGGTTVTLTGSGFQASSPGANVVTFGGLAAAGVTVLDDGTLTCQTPAGSVGTVDVSLSNANGAALLAGAYRYFPATTLTSIEPLRGTPFGGSLVILRGVGFQAESPGPNTVTFGGVPATSILVVDDTTLSCVTPPGLPAAIVDVALSNANGEGTLVAGWTYNAAPVLSSVSPASGISRGGQTITVGGAGFLQLDAGMPVVRFGGVDATGVTVLGDGTLTCLTPAGVVGATVDVELSNGNGTALLPAAFAYTASPPQVLALNPVSGTANGNTGVLVTGSGFVDYEAGINVVTFGGVAAPTVVAFDDATLLCATPPGTPEAVVDVEVTNDNGTGVLVGGFRYHARPTLASVSPESGTRYGGETVTLAGTGFKVDAAGQNRVRFGGMLATGVVVVSDTSLTCVVPQGIAGSIVTVTVVNTNGQAILPNGYRYHAQPSLTSVTPPAASAAGGAVVTLGGTGFEVDAAGANAVTFGGSSAQDVQLVDDGTLLVTVPPGVAGSSVDVVVTNANGSSTLVAGFSYHPTPVLAAIAPATGSTSGGTSVTLTGTGFLVNEPGTNAVTFGGAPATSVAVVSDTSLVCETPPAAVGDVDVVLTNANGSSSLAGAFHYFPAPPTLASVAPASGTSLGGTEVTLSGTGFTANAPGQNLVTFGGVPAAALLVVDDATLVATAPAGAAGSVVDVQVQNDNGADVLAGSFRYHDLPVLASLDPPAAVQTGGSTVTLHGSGFAVDSPGTNLVTIGGAAATNVLVVDDTALTCEVPASAVLGPVDVAVANANGATLLAGALTYVPPPPTITLITPTSGRAVGGDGVAITGTGFTANAAGTNVVTIGGKKASFVVAFDDTTILCGTPAGVAGSLADVQVTNANGTATLGEAFRYHALPVLASVQPASGPFGGGQVLTIAGSGFQVDDPGVTTLQIGGVPVTGLTVLDDATLTCVVPAGVAGTSVDVVLSNDNGLATLPGGYRYHEVPALAAVTPPSAGSPGGRLVTLTGSGFAADSPGTNQVLFGGAAASEVTVVDDATLTCRVPAGTPEATVDVVLSNANGQATAAGAFSYHALPVLASVSPGTGDTNGGTELTLTGSGFLADEAGTPTVTVGGAAAEAVAVVDDATITCLTPTGNVGASDVAVSNANGAASLAGAFTYFAAAPTLAAVAPPSGTSLGGTVLTLTGTGFSAHAPGTNLVAIGGLPATDVTVVDDTTILATTPAGTPGGVVDVALSNDNGSDALAGAFRFHALPTLATVSPLRGDATGGELVTLTGTGFQVDGAGVNLVVFGGQPASAVTVLDDATLTCALPSGPKGTPVSVTLANTNGSASMEDAFTYFGDAPVLLAVDPPAGTKDGGTALTLSGSGFVNGLPGATTVLLGGVPVLELTVVDDGTITCVTPPGPAKVAMDVEVSNENGTSVLAGGFYYHAEPTVAAVSPSGGSPLGGTTIEVQGQGFLDNDAGTNVVTLGGAPATNVVVLDDGHLTCETPAGLEGSTVDLALSNDNGAASLLAAFRYHVQPVLLAVSPAAGSSLGGLDLVLTGTGFQVDGAGPAAVSVGGVPATGVQVVDDTTVHCVSPGGVPGSTADVALSNVNGASDLSAAFTYFALPTVASTSPVSGTSLGGTLVTVSGTGFTANGAGSALVTIGGQPATAVTVVDDTTLRCLTPAGLAGSAAQVVVSNANGASTSPTTFAYHARPTVLAVSPERGSSLGGSQLTITGTGFKVKGAGTNIVRIGGTPAGSVVVVSDSTITCTAPPGPAGLAVDVNVFNGNGSGTLPGGFAYALEPTLLGVAPDHGSSVGGTPVTLTGTGFQVDDAGANVVLFGGVPAGDVLVLSDSTLSCTVPPGTGSATVDLQVTNANGTSILAGSFRYHATPQVLAVRPGDGSSLGGERVTLAGSGFVADAAGQPTVTFDGVRATRVRVESDELLSCNAPAGVPGAAAEVAVSNANGVGARLAAYRYHALPSLTAVVPASGPYPGGQKVTITGTGFATLSGASAPLFGTTGAYQLDGSGRPRLRNRVFFGDVEVSDLVVLSGTLMTCTAPAGLEGSSVDVRLENGDGDALLPAGYRYHLQPTLLALSPPSGPAAGGDLVTLTGTGFQVDSAGEPQVTFEGVPAESVTVVDDAHLTLLVPAGAAGSTVDVALSNANGSTGLAASYRYHAVPTLSGLSAGDGTSLGGTHVTLKGSGFLVDRPGPNTVTFGGRPATGVVVVDDTTLRCLTPAGAPGAVVDVRLANANGSDSRPAAFRFHEVPTLLVVDPSGGTSLGSNLVTLTGSGFQADAPGTNQVLFGGIPASIQAVVDDTTIVVIAPAGAPASTADVTVENDNGAAGLLLAYSYHPLPVLSGVTPDRGPAEGGTSVTLSGSGFLDGAPGTNTVSFGARPAVSVLVVDDQTLVCEVPAGNGGELADLHLSNANGTAALPSSFRWISMNPLDVDNDGLSDLLVGASLDDTGEVNAGRAFVYLGRETAFWYDQTSADADLHVTSFTPTTRFGAQVAGGDVNDDGISDLIVTAPRDDAGAVDAGALAIFFGPVTASLAATDADVVITGNADTDLFGTALCVGDMDGDGVLDLAVGAPGDDQNGVDSGAVFVFFGGPSLASGPASGADVKILGSPSIDGFAESLACGDLDGDGADDLAIGALNSDIAGANAGTVFTVLGLGEAPGIVSSAGPVFTGMAASDRFGLSLVCADVDGDGMDDLVVGAPFHASETGAVHVFHGASNLSGLNASQATLTLLGEVVGGRFGATLATGDVDGDGNLDLAVGATHVDDVRQEVGRVYLFRGVAALTDSSAGVANLMLTGEMSHREHLGAALALTDVNADGRDDLVVAAPDNDGGGLGSGRVYLLLDAATATDMRAASADVLITGAKDSHFGDALGSGD